MTEQWNVLLLNLEELETMANKTKPQEDKWEKLAEEIKAIRKQLAAEKAQVARLADEVKDAKKEAKR